MFIDLLVGTARCDAGVDFECDRSLGSERFPRRIFDLSAKRVTQPFLEEGIGDDDDHARRGAAELSARSEPQFVTLGTDLVGQDATQRGNDFPIVLHHFLHWYVRLMP